MEKQMEDQSDHALAEVLDPPSRLNLRSRIDRMSMSADAKALLYDLVDVTVEVGGRIVAAGRKIIAFVLDLVRRYPNTTFGVIVSFVVSSLIAAIPLLGPLLAPLMAPLLLAFGLAAEALADLKEAGIRSRVSVLEQHLMASTKSG